MPYVKGGSIFGDIGLVPCGQCKTCSQMFAYETSRERHKKFHPDHDC